MPPTRDVRCASRNLPHHPMCTFVDSPGQSFPSSRQRQAPAMQAGIRWRDGAPGRGRAPAGVVTANDVLLEGRTRMVPCATPPAPPNTILEFPPAVSRGLKGLPANPDLSQNYYTNGEISRDLPTMNNSPCTELDVTIMATHCQRYLCWASFRNLISRKCTEGAAVRTSC